MLNLSAKATINQVLGVGLITSKLAHYRCGGSTEFSSFSPNNLTYIDRLERVDLCCMILQSAIKFVYKAELMSCGHST